MATMTMALSPPPRRFSVEHQTHADNKFRKSNSACSFDSVGHSHQKTQSKFYAMTTNGTTLEGGRSASVNADVSNLCGKGQLREALAILHVMDQQSAIKSDTYASLLQLCTDLKALTEGKQVHSHILSNRTEEGVALGEKLLRMYVSCRSIIDARHVFDKMPKRDSLLWNVMIGGYAKHGLSGEALVLYYKMQESGVKPDMFTFPCVLKACAALSALQQGKEIHGCIIRRGLESNVCVQNALVSMYAKCGRIEAASIVFDKMSEKNVISWNAMIGGYAENEHDEEALRLFRRMQMAGRVPDLATMASVIPVCARLAALHHGMEIHGHVIRSGFCLDAVVCNSLIDMYAKCGNLNKALQVFEKMSQRNVVSWTAVIAGHAWNGQCVKALELFYQMQLAGVTPDVVTITSALSVCGQLGALQQGRDIHEYIIKNGFDSGNFVGNALIDMYSKCQSIKDARHVFDQMSQRDVISWNTMITCYSQSGYPEESLKCLRQMQLTLKPNPITIACVLPVCASLAALQHGREIHAFILRNEIFSNVFVGNALIDMYAKCGNIVDARQLFDKMSQRDAVSWTVMIAGYGIHGNGEVALSLFDQMQRAGMMPDHITFIAVLRACSHAGLVDEGWQFFDQMSRVCDITPKLEHYASMVDLLGRAGHLNEAYEFIKEMPLEPDAGVWGALLGACRIHRNIELGERVADHVFELEPENTGYYVLLSNIYAEAGRWDSVAKVRAMMKDRGLKKNPGCSWVVIRNRVHAFLVGDRSHPQAEKIYAMLESLAGRMEEEGYVPNTKFVLHDLEEEMKEHILCGHSEKLAIAFALINTSPGTPIQITKNLRVCGDCHSATKFISKIVRREITLRDTSRFHHFKDGLCSCGDYW